MPVHFKHLPHFSLQDCLGLLSSQPSHSYSSPGAWYPWSGWRGVMWWDNSAKCLCNWRLALCQVQVRDVRRDSRHGILVWEYSIGAALHRWDKCPHYSHSGQDKCLRYLRVDPWYIEENIYLYCLLSHSAVLCQVYHNWIKYASPWHL